MEKTCCVCKNDQLMLYSNKLDMGWCERHMPKKEDYELALAGKIDPEQLKKQ